MSGFFGGKSLLLFAHVRISRRTRSVLRGTRTPRREHAHTRVSLPSFRPLNGALKYEP